MIRISFLLPLILVTASVGLGQETFRPEDPIASVDGSPIFLGELNLVLVDRLKIRDVSQAPINVQQATAATLVRQHLAMKSLRAQGGKALEQMIDRQISDFDRELTRRGSSLQKHAALRSSDESSFKAQLAWEVAWRGYLKSRMTDQNLATFFGRNQQKYAGGRWDVSQIFWKVDVKDPVSLAEAQERLEKLVAEIRQSATPVDAFSAAARENSEGGSANEGGHVGWVASDGDLPGALMSAVRTSAVGSISDVVRSPLGLHVVLVHQYEKGEMGFQDLTDQAQLRRDATDALFHQLVRQQKDAKVSWYIPALKPPANVSLVPQ